MNSIVDMILSRTGLGSPILDGVGRLLMTHILDTVREQLIKAALISDGVWGWPKKIVSITERDVRTTDNCRRNIKYLWGPRVLVEWNDTNTQNKMWLIWYVYYTWMRLWYDQIVFVVENENFLNMNLM